MTSNIRILANDKAKFATITADTTAGTMAASNVQTDTKSQAWRSTGTTATLTLTWATSIVCDTVVFPFTNFSNQPVILINGYTNVADTTPIFSKTSNEVLYSSASSFGFDEMPPAANFFQFGSSVYAAVYLPTMASIKKLVITISDTANTNGYIEIGRLLCGLRFEPDKPTEYGLALTFDDRSTNKRNGAGDSISELKSRFKKLSFSTTFETDNDRKTFQTIMRKCGISTPIFIDADYSNADIDTRQNYMIYGKFSKACEFVHKYFSIYSSSVDIEEV